MNSQSKMTNYTRKLLISRIRFALILEILSDKNIKLSQMIFKKEEHKTQKNKVLFPPQNNVF